jgi:hypothetical protein
VKLHPSSRPSLLAFALLLSPAAWAQSDLVALHPCNIVGVKAKQQVEDLQATCATEIARGDVQLVSSDLVRAFLDKEAKSPKEPQGSCARAKKPSECLGKLAAATQASRAVLITVDPGPLTRVSGLVVNAQGEVVDQKSIQLRIRPGQSQGDVTRTAITRLREQLTLVPLKIAPLVEQPAPPPLVATPEPSTGTAQTTPPPPTQAPPEAIAVRQSPLRTGRTWKTPAAYAGAGVGVVGLGLGVVFAITGNNAMVESNKFYTGTNLPTFNQLGEVVSLREKASRDRTIAGVSAGVGAALVGAGVYLWLTDRPASPAPGTAALSAGPGGVSVHVLLP